MSAWLRHAVLALTLTLACVPVAARAQAPAAPADPGVSTDELRQLSRTLQDPVKRARLVSDLDALIAMRRGVSPAVVTPQAPSDVLVGSIAAAARQMGAHLSALADITPFRTLARSALQTARNPQARMVWLLGLASIAGVLAMAWIVERLARRVLRGLSRRLAPAAQRPPPMAVLAALADGLVRVVPAACFLVAGYTALTIVLVAGGPAIESEWIVRVVVLALINARAIVRACLAVVETLLAHLPARSRPDRQRGETIGYWLVWFIRLLRLSVYGVFVLRALRDIGMDPVAFAIAAKLLGLVFVGLLLMLILQSREPVAQMIRGHHPQGDLPALRGLRARLAETWHAVMILYVLAAYGVWAAGVPGGAAFLIRASVLSVLLAIAARQAARGAKGLADRVLAVSSLLDGHLPGLRERAMRYASALVSTLRAAIALVVIVSGLEIWGFDALAWLTSSQGQGVITAVLTVLITVVAAVVVWEIVSLIIEAYLSRAATDGRPAAQSARARTLLPLLRKALATLLGVTVSLVVLAELGVNIQPLLAGAGIIGIAVGFGAQTLVKDVITGLFILMQDAVAVGDVVSVAGHAGEVEQVSIRSIRLRDLSGTVITIPFSEVTTVQNLTKDFSFAVLDVAVAYREDVDEVIEVIRAVAEELRGDAEVAWRILAPMEIFGLDRFADSAVVIKGRIKTRPLSQWTVMRQFNIRLKRRFDALGIEIPFPHQTVYFGADKAGRAPPAHLSVVDTRRHREAPAREAQALPL